MSNMPLPDDFEDFVSQEVASLCDADPKVLAQYIVALIGKAELSDALKASLEEKLNEFFDDQTVPFIDRLFARINNSNPPTTADRFNEFSDEEDDGDRNFKHRRQRSAEPSEDVGQKRRQQPDDSNHVAKYYRDDTRRPNQPTSVIPGGYNGYNNRGARGGRGRGGNNMNRGSRPQCRDYNEKGFCMRGDTCPYDHGMDRIILDDNVQGYPAPFPPQPIPRMGVRAVPPQNFYGGIPGVIPDAYDPERSLMPPNPDMFQGHPPMDMMMMRGGGRGGGRGGRGGRGGGARYHHQSRNPQNTTLNVEKIPAEFCQIATVNDFFAKFGTITNISVQPAQQKAVIQYSTRQEAESAYSSPDAIFDNRFVKVYWAQDTPAATESATPPPAVPNNEPDPELVAARAAEIAKQKEEKQKKYHDNLKNILEIQKRRETQLQQQIDEQKRLLAKLTNSAGMSQVEKAELLKALKAIQSDIDTSKAAQAAPTPATTTTTTTTTDAPAADTGDGSNSEKPKETTEDLKKKLARLEAEAAQLGIHGSGFRGSRGGYRGRGSWPRVMRGGMSTRMSLDNRPTKIVVKDLPQDAIETDLRQHFEQYGHVTLYEQKEDQVLVQYGQRYEAEKAMNAGPNYSKGTLSLAWVEEQQSSS